MTFRIKLGNRSIEIDSIYDRVRKMCAGYLECAGESESPEGLSTMDEPDLRILITHEDITLEQDCEDNSAFSDPYLETLAAYRKIATGMLRYDTFLMHGAVVAVPDEDGIDRAYMFTAMSGTGKTTHIRMWLNQIPGCYVVNGDKPLISINPSDSDEGKEVAIAHGTPWSGKENMNRNCSVPLAAICILERSAENSIREITFDEAVPTLMRQIYQPTEMEDLMKTMDLINRLGRCVRFYRLGCNMDPEAARVSYEGLTGRRIEP